MGEMTNKVLNGDCLDVMRGMAAESADLVYADPPFNTGKDWGAYDDRFGSMDDYIAWLMERVAEARRLLKPTGSLWLHCDHNASHYIKVGLDKLFGCKMFRNEIVWCYTGASAPGQKQFSRKHDTLFWYSNSNKWTFNKDAVRVPYSPSSIKRAGKRKHRWGGNKDVCELNDLGKIPESWWPEQKGNGLAITCRQPKQYVKYPTQKPVALLERIIRSTSDEGDLVLDPLCGSGTTLVAAKRHARQYIGIDVSDRACALARQRLADVGMPSGPAQYSQGELQFA